MDELTKAATAVCAARLDAGVSFDHFQDLVAGLIVASKRQAIREAMTVPYGNLTGDTAADDDEEEDPEQDPPPPPKPTATATRAALRTGGRRGGNRKLSYDDKVRIQARYDAALEGRQRVPRGFVQNLAVEYDVSEWTINQIGRRKD